MITVETNFREAAKKKINSEKGTMKVKNVDHHQMIADFISGYIADALCTFADQDNEFARAICEGGSFSECMESVLNNKTDNVYKSNSVGINGLSSIRKAVNFYFRGAVINFSMTIFVNPHDAPEETAVPEIVPEKGADEKSVLTMSLDDLF